MEKLKVKVKPNSKKSFIEEKNDYLLIHVKNKPEKNKANNEMINMISKYLKVDKNKISISVGKTNSKKFLKITK